ncbi:hypothetical protein B0H14DRAFT_3127016 [Mycena olivaceomarginata]|nr:hypothetical protein B0H14DRAFT_3127016 [Mycena olivaceomarginata]
MTTQTSRRRHSAHPTQYAGRVESDFPSGPSERLAILPSPTLTASEIRSRLLEIENQKERLRVERKHLLESLDSIVYPVLTLPPEITSEIFIHCVRGYTRHGPLLVASVCKAWRTIALTTPVLWSEFQGSRFGGSMGRGNPVSLLQCWLPRAGIRPLTLEAIELGEFSHEDVLSSIAPYASQWMSLDLTAGFRPIVFPVGAIRKPLSSLKTLKIQVHRWPVGGPTCITAFAAAPELREIHLIRMSLPQISLPWIQITRLTLSYQSLPQIFEILQQTSNLEDLTVSLDDRHIVQLSPFTLPRLRRVKLSSALILNYLTLPALQSLDLTRVRAAERASVQSLLQRSECAIRTFHLNMTDMQDTCDCLSDLPSVADVTIQYPDWSTGDFTRFFNWLSESENRTVLPALEMLYIHGATGNVEVGAIEAFLSARRTSADGGPKLKLFKLLFSYKNCPDFQVERTLKRLADLRTGGLHIDVTQAHKWATHYIDSKMMQVISGEDTAERNAG